MKINEKTGRLEALSDMLRLCAGCDCETCGRKHCDKDCTNTYTEAADLLDEYAQVLREKGEANA